MDIFMITQRKKIIPNKFIFPINPFLCYKDDMSPIKVTGDIMEFRRARIYLPNKMIPYKYHWFHQLYIYTENMSTDIMLHQISSTAFQSQ